MPIMTFNRTSMELKHWKEKLMQAILFTFNRTSMELKQCLTLYRYWQRETFNRTSMELKPESQRRAERDILLLIEPVWN